MSVAMVKGRASYVVPVEAIEWDVPTWRRVFEHWEHAVENLQASSQFPIRALELGSKRGGASLFLAQRFGASVVCSDFGGPHNDAEPLHEQFGVRDKITYADIDATKIALDSGSFDVVVFKSILGSIGGVVGPHAVTTALQEMRRVLRPGGLLLFAENLAATPIHMFLRRRLRPWGGGWHYLQYEELRTNLRNAFSSVDYRTTGFGCVGVPQRFASLQRGVGHVDAALDKVLPDHFKYVAFGDAQS